MSRLIDADELKEYITKAYEERKSEFKTDKYRDMAKLVTESFCMDIDEAPTVDAVEVVRCKDCVFKKGEHLCLFSGAVENEGYCHRGKSYPWRR